MPDIVTPDPLTSDDSRYRDPLIHVDWPQLHMRGPWLPREALSLHGLPEFDALDDESILSLSRYEFVNVMYCGVWLESIFLQRVSRLLRPSMPHAEYSRLLHEMREETGHSLMFLRAIDSSRLTLPAGAWRAPRVAALLGRFAPAGGTLFWLAMLIGEHVSDGFNRQICDADAGIPINPAVRGICMLHVADEARHIQHAHRMLSAALARHGMAGRAVFSVAARVLLWQMTSVFYFPPSRFYALAGLPGGIDWHAASLRNPVRRRFITRCLAPTHGLLQSLGLRTGSMVTAQRNANKSFINN